MEIIEEHEDDFYNGTTPSGAGRDGYEVYTESADSPLGRAIRDLIIDKTGESPWNISLEGNPQLTVHHAWSGYSEYTITSTWDEMQINWGDYELNFESMPEFFRAVSEAWAD